MRAVPFRLNRSGLMLALVSAALATEAHAAAGRTEFVIGGVTVARNGVERPLARGTELDNGDTVRTNNGRAQIRFTDGAYVSLQPNTEYSIRDYQYDGAGAAEERGFFGLLKGAMRTVTGAIGRINRNAYRISTPTATVGIRGTGGVIQVEDDGSTRVIGTSGIWSLSNPAGSVDVPAGTSAVAPSDPNQPPQETSQQPTSGPAPVPEEEPVFIAGEEVDEQGLPVIPQPSVLVTGNGFAPVLAFATPVDGFAGDIASGGSSPAVFDSLGRLTEVTIAGEVYRLEEAAGGTHAEFGTDGILAWGRWTGRVTMPLAFQQAFIDYEPDHGLHYVIGLPTATLPTSGPAMYTLVGATSPTYVDGQTFSPGTFAGTLAVNFAGSATIDADFTITMPDRVYGMSGRTTTTSALFSMSLGTSGITGCVSSTCSGRIDGFFAGANAERAGVGYHIRDLSLSKELVGAAAFQKQ